jgi:hypothetical protein
LAEGRFSIPYAMLHPSTARQLLQHEVRSKNLTPRVKLAARLYATGVAKTKRQAAQMAGLSESVFYITSISEPKVSELIAQIDREMESDQINMGKLIQKLGRRAVRNVAQIMENPQVKDEVRLKAAQDLADRSPETSKVLNIHATIAAPISDEQFELMRKAMLESESAKAQFADAAKGNYVTVNDAGTSRALELVSDNAPKQLSEGEAA